MAIKERVTTCQHCGKETHNFHSIPADGIDVVCNDCWAREGLQARYDAEREEHRRRKAANTTRRHVQVWGDQWLVSEGIANTGVYVLLWQGWLDIERGEAGLDDVFTILNTEYPADYHAPSLSVGMVVTLDHEGSWFCDSHGWNKLDPLLDILHGAQYPCPLPPVWRLNAPTYGALKAFAEATNREFRAYTKDYPEPDDSSPVEVSRYRGHFENSRYYVRVPAHAGAPITGDGWRLAGFLDYFPKGEQA